MKLDLIDKFILTNLKDILEKLIPIKFTGELAYVNRYIRLIFLLIILGEITVGFFKRREGKKKNQLFGRNRNS